MYAAYSGIRQSTCTNEENASRVSRTKGGSVKKCVNLTSSLNYAETFRPSELMLETKNMRQSTPYATVKTSSFHLKRWILQKIVFVRGVIPKSDILRRSSRDCVDAVWQIQLGQKACDSPWRAASNAANRIILCRPWIFLLIFLWSPKIRQNTVWQPYWGYITFYWISVIAARPRHKYIQYARGASPPRHHDVTVHRNQRHAPTSMLFNTTNALVEV